MCGSAQDLWHFWEGELFGNRGAPWGIQLDIHVGAVDRGAAAGVVEEKRSARKVWNRRLPASSLTGGSEGPSGDRPLPGAAGARDGGVQIREGYMDQTGTLPWGPDRKASSGVQSGQLPGSAWRERANSRSTGGMCPSAVPGRVF